MPAHGGEFTVPGSGGAHGGEPPSAKAAIAKMHIKRSDVASFFRFFIVFSKVGLGLASFLDEQDGACFRSGIDFQVIQQPLRYSGARILSPL